MYQQPPQIDAMTAVLAMAVCDLLVNERARFRTVLELLETKGLLSSAEVDEAIRSKRPLSPEEAENESQIVLKMLQERMMARSQQMALQFGPTGPPQ
jgi:hypothetical protein